MTGTHDHRQDNGQDDWQGDRHGRHGRLSAWMLGLALGGVFDGIVLHQLLQWHHLLSQVPAAGGLPRQVVWDGWFHAAMYALGAAALVGLWRLWRRRRQIPGRVLAAGLLGGFGLWNVLDAVLAHWLLQLHRIRPGAEWPLAWDLGWLAVFGLLPLAAAWALARRR